MGTLNRRDNVERVKKYLLGAFVCSILIFYIALHLRIERTKAELLVKLTAFDSQMNDFALQFARVKPYINRLADHYGCPSEETDTKALRPVLKEFNYNVGEYCHERSDDNFRRVSVLMERITQSEEGKPIALAQMVNLKSHPLTISIFMLAPIPSKHLIPAQSALVKDSLVKKDQLMLYLATLRQPNIFRTFFNIFIWMKNYDDNEEFAQFGNVFSYKNTEMSISGRLKQFIPELTIESENIEEILKNSKLITAPHKFSLTTSTSDIIKSTCESSNSSVIVVNTWPKSIKYFSQISEQYDKMYLKAMLVEKDNKIAVIVFNKSFQIWTMFTEDVRVLSMPRQIARLYYVRYGKYLIYSV